MFVDFYESLLVEKYCKPHLYLRYIDSTFSVFGSINDVEAFHSQNISFNPCIQFTPEVKNSCTLPFWGVLVELKDGRFITSVCRQPTFTGIYTNWNFSFLSVVR